MTSEEFVKRIQVAVYDSATRGALSLLERPPGRRPSQALVRLSHWFNGLSPQDKEHIRSIIQMAVGNAVFGMLTVLDGERSIRKTKEETGALELYYRMEGQSVLLNDPEGEPLHDIFGALVPPA
jgi:hypothetical protein